MTSIFTPGQKIETKYGHSVIVIEANRESLICEYDENQEFPAGDRLTLNVSEIASN